MDNWGLIQRINVVMADLVRTDLLLAYLVVDRLFSVKVCKGGTL